MNRDVMFLLQLYRLSLLLQNNYIITNNALLDLY